MEILYLIGNGFDINAGLKTKANEVVGSYVKSLNDRIGSGEKLPAGVQRLLKSMEDDVESWSDFEMRFGKFSSDLESESEPSKCFIEAFNDFRRFFAEAIGEENERINGAGIETDSLKQFEDGITKCLGDALRPRDKKILSEHLVKRADWNIGFITFNYTTLLDAMVERTNEESRVPTSCTVDGRVCLRMPHSPVHVHGTLNQDGGILIGVDSPDQIVSAQIRGNFAINNAFVKPIENARSGMLHDEEAERLISQADLICIFGMSLGETDATWWSQVAKRVANQNANCLLVIGQRSLDAPSYLAEAVPDEAERVINRFLGVANVQEDADRKRIAEHTLVSFGSKAFDINYHLSDASEER